jgi:chromosome segregation ATPase
MSECKHDLTSNGICTACHADARVVVCDLQQRIAIAESELAEARIECEQYKNERNRARLEETQRYLEERRKLREEVSHWRVHAEMLTADRAALQREVVRLKAQFAPDWSLHDALEDSLEERDAEIERLRKALQTIAEPSAERHDVEALRQIARAARGGKE